MELKKPLEDFETTKIWKWGIQILRLFLIL